MILRIGYFIYTDCQTDTCSVYLLSFRCIFTNCLHSVVAGCLLFILTAKVIVSVLCLTKHFIV